MRRTGFTLLEVVLATAIGLLLLTALYSAMTVQLHLAQAARTRVAESTLVRSIQARISNDVVANIGPIIPSSSAGGRGGGAGAGGASGAAAAGAAGASSPSGAAAGGTSGTAGSGAATSSPAANSILFNLGVQGDQTHVVLYLSRLPRELDANPNGTSDGSPPGICDLRRITYWLATNNGGLARQELKTVTSDDLNSTPPDNLPQDESTYIIAEEIKNLAFSYFDGMNWNDTWDGTTPGNDGVTPIGPPMAIAVEMGVQFPGSTEIKKFRHVIAIPAANGQGNPPPPTNPPVNAAGSTSSSSSSSPSTSTTGQ
jgi:prepilin-type N-terminal cleavage/methylation domain-containing protein